MNALFLVCALSLPAVPFHAPILHTARRTEQQKIEDWLRRKNPGAEVFIHEKPQRDKLRNDGWEQTPFLWNNKEVWIKRRPATDRRITKESA